MVLFYFHRVHTIGMCFPRKQKRRRKKLLKEPFYTRNILSNFSNQKLTQIIFPNQLRSTLSKNSFFFLLNHFQLKMLIQTENEICCPLSKSFYFCSLRERESARFQFPLHSFFLIVGYVPRYFAN